jgi:hypothetical protein
MVSGICIVLTKNQVNKITERPVLRQLQRGRCQNQQRNSAINAAFTLCTRSQMFRQRGLVCPDLKSSFVSVLLLPVRRTVHRSPQGRR